MKQKFLCKRFFFKRFFMKIMKNRFFMEIMKNKIIILSTHFDNYLSLSWGYRIVDHSLCGLLFYFIFMIIIKSIILLYKFFLR